MVTKSAWLTRTLAAWDDEACPLCGRVHPACDVSEDGGVWAWCPINDREILLGVEHWPTSFDPEPPTPDDLPF